MTKGTRGTKKTRKTHETAPLRQGLDSWQEARSSLPTSPAAEVQTHLYIALDQGYIDQEKFDEVYERPNKAAR
jgi:hypothetical protein